MFQVVGFFEHPKKSKSRTLAQFSYKDDLSTRTEALTIANEWKITMRYDFVFVKDTKTQEMEEVL